MSENFETLNSKLIVICRMFCKKCRSEEIELPALNNFEEVANCARCACSDIGIKMIRTEVKEGQ
jgi:hypothetical protein